MRNPTPIYYKMCVGTLVPEIKIMIDLAVGLVSGYYLNLFVVITQCCMGLVVVAGV